MKSRKLLLIALYGLVNSNTKWQKTFDQLFKYFGLIQCQQIPELFYKQENNQLILTAAKTVNYIKVAGAGENAECFWLHLMKRLNKERSRLELVE